MPHVQPQAGADYIERPEFEQRFEDLNRKVDRGFDAVGSAIAAVSKKIEQRDEQSRPKPGLLIAATAGIGIPMLLAAFALVRNMTQLEAVRTWADGHEQFSQAKSTELADTITSKTAELGAELVRLREQQARNVTMLDEQEMQHRWIADVRNFEATYQEAKTGARCELCEREGRPSNLIRFPARGYFPLQQIGQASH